jgi:N-acetylglucosamine kinase-like BadF-type ATPase
VSDLSQRNVLGVDAGNSKTIAILARGDGSILGWGRSGCGDIYGADEQSALDAIAAASHEATRTAGLGTNALSAVVLSAAGADWPEDFETIRDGVMTRGVGGEDSRSHPPLIFNDAIGGLRAGSPDGTGVAVICGTGVAVGSRANDGRLWHSSFWQGPQGGAALGRATFDAVVRTELGLGPSTALTSAVLTHFGARSVEEALHLCTMRGQPHPPMQPLTRVLFDVADQGDALARRMVMAHGHALGDYALVAAHKVGIENEPFHLVLAGGVMRHRSSLLRDAIIARVHDSSPDARVSNDAMEPAIGAVMLALEAQAITITPEVRGRLRETLPDAELFAT